MRLKGQVSNLFLALHKFVVLAFEQMCVDIPTGITHFITNFRVLFVMRKAMSSGSATTYNWSIRLATGLRIIIDGNELEMSKI